MKYLEHIIDPDRLLLLWRTVDPSTNESSGRKFLVGEVRCQNNNLYLQYFDNADTAAAQKLNFKGMTAYPYEPNKVYNGNVKDILAKRIASPSRADYADYLRSYRIDPARATRLSLMQLLANTGGVLTGDGFLFVPAFENLAPPYDFIVEIAGFRHCDGMKIQPLVKLLDQEITFKAEPSNEKDPDAVAIYFGQTKLGYVSKGLATMFKQHVLDKHKIKASITKVNGTIDRPKVSALVQVT